MFEYLSELTPAEIQEFAFGFFFFVTAVGSLFIFSMSRRNHLAFLFAFVVLYGSIINLFSFLYHTTDVLSLARTYRVISQFFTIPFIIQLIIFSVSFYEQYCGRRTVFRILAWFLGAGALLSAPFFALDLAGSHYLIGQLTDSPAVALSPEPGTYLLPYIVLFGLAALLSSVLVILVWRYATTAAARTTGFLMLLCLEIPMFARLMSYAPWYGLGEIGTASLFVALISGPAFAFGTAYAILRHRLFNMRLIATELLVLALIMFILMRAITAASLQDALPEIGVLMLSIALGLFLFYPYGRPMNSKSE